ERDRAGRLLREQAGQDAAVAGGDDVAEILPADDGTGIDEAGQEIVAVLAVGVRQVGADRRALVEETVARGAAPAEHLPAADPGRARGRGGRRAGRWRAAASRRASPPACRA